MFLEFLNQNIWAVVAFAIVFNLLLMSIMQGHVQGANMVSALEMPQLQRSGKSVVLDVNTSANFAAQHIPNASTIPWEDISAENKELLKHKKSTTIVVCQSGSRSAKAAKKLVALGFDNVNILRGGLMGWTKENLPVASS
jgi:rhodanese-related sulfurtransferase